MSKLSVLDRTGATVAEIEVPDAGLTLKRGEQAVHDVVTAYLAGQRAGTASTLGKSEVAASRIKPWRQKGLGRARAGYRASPVWRGGGIAFGPKPRSFAKKVPRKVRDLAFRRALSDKIVAGGLRVLESFETDAPKTKAFDAALNSVGAVGMTVCAPAEISESVRRASANLQRVELVRARDLNVYQILRYPLLLTDRAGWAVLEKRLLVAEGDAE